ncbi:hypothetical protein MBANPS3_011426 [Mucor bainieri]
MSEDISMESVNAINNNNSGYTRKVREPEVFNGDRDAIMVNSWFYSVELYFSLVKIDNTEHAPQDWEEFKAALRNEFIPIDALAKARDRMTGLPPQSPNRHKLQLPVNQRTLRTGKTLSDKFDSLKSSYQSLFVKNNRTGAGGGPLPFPFDKMDVFLGDDPTVNSEATFSSHKFGMRYGEDSFESSSGSSPSGSSFGSFFIQERSRVSVPTLMNSSPSAPSNSTPTAPRRSSTPPAKKRKTASTTDNARDEVFRKMAEFQAKLDKALEDLQANKSISYTVVDSAERQQFYRDLIHFLDHEV